MLKKLFTYITQRHRLPLTGVLCLIVVYASAQTVLFPRVSLAGAMYSLQNPQDTVRPPDSSVQSTPDGETKIIRLIFSKTWSKRPGNTIDVLKDSVILYHDGAYLYCDSAYFSQDENYFEAFSNVRMEQGDTIFLYGDYMEYDGNTQLVKVRDNVSMVHTPQAVTLFTDNLDYDRAQNLGYYFDGGMLVDTLNELTSFWGQYEPNINLATFRDSVILTNPNFKLYSDYLLYHTDTKIANITTPTTIVSDSGYIYTDHGWYNTDTEATVLLDQSTIINKEGNRILRGDSIFYQKLRGFGEVFGNMYVQDTLKKVILRGHYGYYNEITDYVMATDSAFAIEYSQGDSLYIHADTLKLIAVTDTVKYVIGTDTPLVQLSDSIYESPSDSLAMVADSLGAALVVVPGAALQADSMPVVPVLADSLPPGSVPLIPLQFMDSAMLAIDSLTAPVITEPLTRDSIVTYRQIKAYYGVRFYRSDIQGVCDSLQTSSKDSILYMYKDPVLWNTGANITNRQVYGDTIKIFMNDSTIDYMHVAPNSFVIEEKDSIHYNQLKSRSLKVYFENSEISRVFAEGNVQTIAYPEENDGSLSLILQWFESSFMDITFEDGLFNNMVIYPKPVGRTVPFELVTPEDLRLEDFYWFDYLRPLNKDDIFREVSRRADVKIRRRSSIFDRVEE